MGLLAKWRVLKFLNNQIISKSTMLDPQFVSTEVEAFELGANFYKQVESSYLMNNLMSNRPVCELPKLV